MSRSKLILSLVALMALAGLCLYLNRDWFAKPTIHIYHRISPQAAPVAGQRGAAAQRAAALAGLTPVVFGFDTQYRLLSVQVLSIAELQTNKYAHPLWELCTESNSIPISGITYGVTVKGMHPKVKNARAEPLLPDTKYRLLIRTPKLTGEHDFTMPPAPKQSP